MHHTFTIWWITHYFIDKIIVCNFPISSIYSQSGVFMSSTDTYWVCSWWTCIDTPFRVESTKLRESNFHMWVSFIKCNKQFMKIAQNYLLLFVTPLCLHNPFSQEAVSCIHHPHRKHEQDQLFIGSLLYLFLVSLCKYLLSLLQFSCRSD